MRFQFPATRFVGDCSIKEQAVKVSEEATELYCAVILMDTDQRQAEEALDVLQATETLLRQLEAKHGPGWLQDRFCEVQMKNRRRGYYVES